MPLTVVTTGRLIAYRNASDAVTAFSLTAVPSPPRLFIPIGAMPWRRSSGSTCRSKLRNVPSNALSGIWQLSNR